MIKYKFKINKKISLYISLLVIISTTIIGVTFYHLKSSTEVYLEMYDQGTVSVMDSETAECMNFSSQFDSDLVLYEGPVRNIFFHSLIVYPELAFDGGKHQTNYNYWMVTVAEFKKILNSLYEKDYVLIDIDSLYSREKNNQTKLTKNELYLPKGKKPLLLTIDDLNYYKYMEGDGFADKLVIDTEGYVSTLTKTLDGNSIVLRDNDCVPIIDKFVEDHPDFSIDNAKGVIAVTGYEGVFGYNTHLLNSSSYKKDAENVKAIANTLKKNGWKFASHSYGNINIAMKSIERLKRDTVKWHREVEQLIGTTNLYIYPFGAKINPSDPKFNYLKSSGFDVFLGVGNKTNFRIINNGVHMERLNIDGYKMHYAPNQMSDLFNISEVYDSTRPSFGK